jgi:hypothetical protein
MAKRKLLYYWDIQSQNPQIFVYHFLVQNNIREINQIKNKLFAQLKPLEETATLASGLISHSDGIHYDLFSVFSNLPEEFIDFKKIYEGKVKKDRRLQSRASEAGWDGLIKKIEQDKI